MGVITIPIEISEVVAVYKWCEDNCKEYFTTCPSPFDIEPVDIHGPRVIFAHINDALRFKLEWISS